jgi:hypothetical protein
MSDVPAGSLDGSISALAGVAAGDVDAIARVGASALLTGRAALAQKVFAGLAALEPAVGRHRLFLAEAHKLAGDSAGARATLDALIDDAAADEATLVHALVARATLRSADRDGARSDLSRAKVLAEGSAEARAAWEQAT